MLVIPGRWRRDRIAPRAAAMLSVGLLAVSLGTVATVPSAGAATDNGAVSIVAPNGAQGPLRRGGSATPFTLKLGRNPACPGDSSGGDYRVQSFMIPASADVNALTFGSSGPVAVDGQFRQPLFAVDSSPYVDELTDLAVAPAVTGGISGLPSFDFGVFAPGDVPAGRYRIGIACTLGQAGPNQLKTFWSATVTIAVSADDLPAGITWASSAPAPAPSDPRGPSPAGGGPGPGGGPTTTVPGGGPTTTAVDSTTTTSVSDAAAFSGANPSDPSVSSTLGQLPLTGSSTWHRAVWGVCLILLARVLYLFVRRPKVRPPSAE